MKAPNYQMLLTLLGSAKQLLAKNAGHLNPADLRIRCLVNITEKEARRALLEENASARTAESAPAAGEDNPGRTARPPAHGEAVSAVGAR